ncbi:MAG: Na+/H+-dicarboxylate symporter [Hyphomicrobiaceae bacterium]|jgi:Na+/H+-dicarboxylate symporter
MTQSPGHPRSTLTRRILIGMALGFIAGLGLESAPLPVAFSEFVVDDVFRVGGALFLASLKLLVVPLVFVSIVCGTAALDDVAKLGRLGLRTLTLYLGSTAIAVSLALGIAALVSPGAGFELSTDATFVAPASPSLADTIIALVPTNPLAAMTDGNMLQIITFAVLFGVAITLSKDSGARILSTFRDLDAIIMRLVDMVMTVAPYGVFCLVARVFAAQGLDAFAPLLRYFGCVASVLFLHVAVTYSLALRILAGRSPIKFFTAMRPVALVAFSTSSSNATIPVTREIVEKRLNVPSSIASFTIPLGATINMDGTAIMQGVATAFIAQAYGIELTFGAYLSVVLTATLASVGTAGVPGVGLVTLAMVLRQVGLPVEGIGLIIGVDRLLDMLRTAVNVLGDAAVTCIVARFEAGGPQAEGAAVS